MSKRAEQQIIQRLQMSGDLKALIQLCLDDIRMNQITPSSKRRIQQCINLQYLMLNECQLSALTNFPHLPKLIGLQLSGNKLTGQDLSSITHNQQIHFLSLDSNKIINPIYLQQLRTLPSLQIIQLHHNPFSQNDNYRQNIFERLPSLTIVDCRDRQGNERKQEEQDYITNRFRSSQNMQDFQDNDQQEQDIDELSLELRAKNKSKANQQNSTCEKKNGVIVEQQSRKIVSIKSYDRYQVRGDEESSSQQEGGEMMQHFRKVVKK